MSDSVDIVIVGAGLVGSPLALALASAGWQVALLDRQSTPGTPSDPLDQRCTALSLGTKLILQRHGLWSAVREDAAAIRHVHVSQRSHFGATRIHADEEGVEALGYVVENRRFLTALEERFETLPVRRISAASLESVQSGSQQVSVCYRHDGQAHVLKAKLLIGTDGVGSAVREALQIGVDQTDYRQSSVLGTLAVDTSAVSHDGVAFERFTQEGALALLPRHDGVTSFVRCVNPETGTRLMSLDDEGFLADMQRAFGHRTGRFVRSGSRTIVPLMRIEARRQIDQRAVLLGNAARLLHPVAGQGYNLAMRDVDALLARLSGERAAGSGPAGGRSDDPGSSALLDAFLAERRFDQWRTVRLTDTLARGFRGSSNTLGHLRGAALIGLDAISPLRHGFARLCMGL